MNFLDGLVCSFHSQNGVKPCRVFVFFLGGDHGSKIHQNKSRRFVCLVTKSRWVDCKLHLGPKTLGQKPGPLCGWRFYRPKMPQELWQKHLSTKQPVIFRAEDGLRYLKTFRWEIISLYIYTYNIYIYSIRRRKYIIYESTIIYTYRSMRFSSLLREGWLKPKQKSPGRSGPVHLGSSVLSNGWIWRAYTFET